MIMINTLLTPDVLEIMRIIKIANGEARLVGGCVRDALIGKKCADYDLATTLLPNEIIATFEKEKIPVILTGIDHGTVTVVMNNVNYEITTLRIDAETDGRHAKVIFTDNWKADAQRRDFTINAIYVDSNGNTYDYFDGIKDIKDGYIRFVGDAAQRINEDALRILRYFRFVARFSAPRWIFNYSAMSEIEKNIHLTKALSQERVTAEVIKFLSISAANIVFDKFSENVYIHIFKETALPKTTADSNFNTLVQLENKLFKHLSDIGNTALRRFFILHKHDVNFKTIACNWKMSNDDKTYLINMQNQLKTLNENFNVRPSDMKKEIKKLLESYSQAFVFDCMLLFYTDKNTYANEIHIDDAFNTVLTWKPIKFPINGYDIISFGIKPGKEIRNILDNVYDYWRKNDYLPGKNDCIAFIKRILK